MTIAVRPIVQAWITLRADDPEAVSAALVARSAPGIGRGLVALERRRLIEIAGTPREDEQVAALLHGSTQFYNPHKEHCAVGPGGGPDAARSVQAVVWERGGERRAAAERWWRHETGEDVEVREAVVWSARFDAGVDGATAMRELVELRDSRHGLLCNPWSQQSRISPQAPPWIAAAGGDR